MIRARVDVRDLMTLRAAALQAQARRGAQFAPPEVIPASPSPRPVKPGPAPVETAPVTPAAPTRPAAPPPAPPTPAPPSPVAPPPAPTPDVHPEDAAGAWMDESAGVPDDLLDHLAGQGGWEAEHTPDPQDFGGRTESRAAPTRPASPAPPISPGGEPAVSSSAAPPSPAAPAEDAFSLPDFTEAPPEDATSAAQLALSQLLREQLKVSADRSRARDTGLKPKNWTVRCRELSVSCSTGASHPLSPSAGVWPGCSRFPERRQTVCHARLPPQVRQLLRAGPARLLRPLATRHRPRAGPAVLQPGPRPRTGPGP